ncbi:hypothetical protein [Halorubrum sp. JWXQ-INN 858]|uniref:hypothetical protein n=1 Tax=Halorubrum sp. JWXQ-INN 858 TaxID=2690782 RepID=UPI00135C7BBE|nr:hypothetical protein [Halorubrum sp. JWXQ-INN 858]
MSNNTSHSITHTPMRIGAALSAKFRTLTARGIRAAAFWAAVLLPVAYVPVFYGVGGVDGTWSFFALLALHIACVVIGHDHNCPAADGSAPLEH